MTQRHLSMYSSYCATHYYELTMPLQLRVPGTSPELISLVGSSGFAERLTIELLHNVHVGTSVVGTAAFGVTVGCLSRLYVSLDK